MKTKKYIMWQFVKDLNDFNNAILTEDEDWDGLKSAEQIISITYNTNHGCYVVLWRYED